MAILSEIVFLLTPRGLLLNTEHERMLEKRTQQKKLSMVQGQSKKYNI